MAAAHLSSYQTPRTPRHVTTQRATVDEAEQAFTLATTPRERADALSLLTRGRADGLSPLSAHEKGVGFGENEILAGGALLLRAVGATASGEPSLAAYARRGEDRRPVDVWIARQDLYHFPWWKINGTVDKPSDVTQVLSLADDTTRRRHASEIRVHQNVLAHGLHGDGPGRPANPRARLPLALLQAWHENGMTMSTAAAVLTQPYGFTDERWDQARVARLAVIGRLPAADIPAAAQWVIHHVGPEPAPSQRSLCPLSDWHAMMERERVSDHNWDIGPYRRDQTFLGVASGLSDAMTKHGSTGLSDNQRQRLVEIGMALCLAEQPPNCRSSVPQCAQAGGALVASASTCARPHR